MSRTHERLVAFTQEKNECVAALERELGYFDENAAIAALQECLSSRMSNKARDEYLASHEREKWSTKQTEDS